MLTCVSPPVTRRRVNHHGVNRTRSSAPPTVTLPSLPRSMATRAFRHRGMALLLLLATLLVLAVRAAAERDARPPPPGTYVFCLRGSNRYRLSCLFKAPPVACRNARGALHNLPPCSSVHLGNGWYQADYFPLGSNPCPSNRPRNGGYPQC
jgi:hypothetical protein